MVDHDDDVVIVAASFLYFLMKRMPVQKIEYPCSEALKRHRRFWIYDTLHRRQVINRFVNIKLITAVVGRRLFMRIERQA